MGLALYHSLCKHLPQAELWVICLDEQAEFALKKLKLPALHPIPLKQVESTDLLAVKPTRTRAEYCWTLTPFTMEAVFARNHDVRRVTYIDADLLFFNSPQSLFDEFDESGKQVLITEHAYAPEYDQTATSGRFCVQFITFRRTEAALEVIHWWQQRCLECCSEIPIDGKFGDQKYLDEWPTLFGDRVHILEATELTIAPWNVGHLLAQHHDLLHPVFYHFHGLRLFRHRRCRLYSGYRIPPTANWIYEAYLSELVHAFDLLMQRDIRISYPSLDKSPKEVARRFKRKWKQTEAWCQLPRAPF
ncbi:MAG: glycosyl transferase [Planctomyces sp.]|nr:glycosyl transferase [Planctomyces sp.]